MADPLKNGLEWIVIRGSVDKQWPTLADWLQEALNSGHGTERLQTKVQTMLEVHQKAMRNFRVSGEYGWDIIAKTIENDRPHMAGHVMPICAFVANWSGGASGNYLSELDAWAKTLKVRRDVSGTIYKLLADLRFVQGPEIVFAMLKACFVSPESMCKNGVSVLLSGQDMATVTGKGKHTVLEFIAMLRKAKDWLREIRASSELTGNLTDSDVARLLGDFEVRVVMFLFKKKVRSRKEWQSLDEIGSQLLNDVYDLAPASAKLEPPFDVKAANHIKRTGVVELAMRGFEAKGVDDATLNAMGFEVGSEVEPTAGAAERFKIVSIVNGVAQLTAVGPKKPKKMTEKKIEVATGVL
eukprot:8108084-Pyramimonas_sp.AAC.1